MEWFWRFIDHLQQSAAGSALQRFSVIDWIFLCAIVWGMIQGSRKGFSEMFWKLLGLFLVSMLTLSFYEAGAVNIVEQIPSFPIKAAETFSFFLLAIFLWLSVSWSINLFGKFFKVEAQGFLKTLGGV
ncbi:MAG: CvpA family protein, partial [Candidatus Omnitrophica bacterium]|nr:CvpA family protein [Candidatus Omnitrophota bacterium]